MFLILFDYVFGLLGDWDVVLFGIGFMEWLSFFGFLKVLVGRILNFLFIFWEEWFKCKLLGLKVGLGVGMLFIGNRGVCVLLGSWIENLLGVWVGVWKGFGGEFCLFCVLFIWWYWYCFLWSGFGV